MNEDLGVKPIVLDPEQYEALAELAAREGHSVADEVREIVRRYLEDNPLDSLSAVRTIAEIRHEYQVAQQRAVALPVGERLAVLERIRQHREAILAQNGGQPLDFDVVTEINRMREERDAEILDTPFDSGN